MNSTNKKRKISGAEPKKCRLFDQLKIDMAPNFLEPNKTIGSEYRASRFGRIIKNRCNGAHFTFSKSRKSSTTTSFTQLIHNEPIRRNKRKVRHLVPIERIPDNPLLRLIPSNLLLFSNSPIDKLLKLNKTGLNDPFQEGHQSNTIIINDEMDWDKYEFQNQINDNHIKIDDKENTECIDISDGNTGMDSLEVHNNISETSQTVSDEVISVSDVDMMSLYLNPTSAGSTTTMATDCSYDLKPGDLVWASLGNWPFWPAIVYPDDEQIHQKENRTHVKFLSDNGRVSWVASKSGILNYEGQEKYEMICNEKKLLNSQKQCRKKFTVPLHNTVWKMAVAEANLLAHVESSYRITFYDFILMPALIDNRITDIRFPSSSSVNESDRGSSTTPLTVDTAYSSMKQSASPLSISSTLGDGELNTDFNLTTSQVNTANHIENYLLSVEENKRQMDLEIMDEDFSTTCSKPQSPASSYTNDIAPFDTDNILISVIHELIEQHFNCDVIALDYAPHFNESVMQLWSLFKIQKESKKRKRITLPEVSQPKKRRSEANGSIASKRSFSIEYDTAPPIRDPEEWKRQQTIKKKETEEEKSKQVVENVATYSMNQYAKNVLFKTVPDEFVCRICFEPGNIALCSGICGGRYHPKCAKSMERLTDSDWQIYFKQHFVKKLKCNDPSPVPVGNKCSVKSILCRECASPEIPKCFVCSKGDGVRIRCSEKNCGKAYHLECLNYWPQHKKSYVGKGGLVCPCHTCQICISENPNSLKYNICGDRKFIKCLLCPATYHRKSSCIPAGSALLSHSEMICPRHRANKRRPINANWCFLCTKGGSLICCETCPSAFHQECLKLQVPDKYICEECESGRLPLYGEIVWAKLGIHKWWPSIILPPSEVSDKLLACQQDANHFCVFFFGTHNCAWICRDYVYLYQEDDCKFNNQEFQGEFMFRKACAEAKECYALMKMKPSRYNSEGRNSHLKPAPYKKIKYNYVVPPVKWESGHYSFTDCECKPNDPYACSLNSGCINYYLCIECNPTCRAGENCQNQRFEKCIYPKLEVRRMESRGWGLIALENIPNNTFIIEYVGDVINDEEFRRRFEQSRKEKDENFYFLQLGHNLYIDAGRRGNLARFANHSCAPNCAAQTWTVKGKTRIGLFSVMDIPANTELTFNYNWSEMFGSKTVCLCGADTCSGFIGSKAKKAKIHHR